MNPFLCFSIFAVAGTPVLSVHGQPLAPAESPPQSTVIERISLSANSAEFHHEPLATTEWTFHKNGDGSRPSGVEQQYVWLMNRARTNPEVEGIWLSLVRENGVRSAINFFSVNLDIMRDEFEVISSNPPAAFDIRLHNAALDHSNYLISIDGQNHNNQFQRVTDAGFVYTSIGGSVFSYSRNGLYGHAGFNIDWGGNDGTGMQTGRGHRAGLMSSRANVGVGIALDNNGSTSVGPQVTTINYANGSTFSANHYNRFIVGTVWEDSNGNSFYDPGEGIGGVTVQPDSGDFYAITGDAGGYAVPVDPGSYVVTFSGGSLSSPVVKNVTVGTTSELIPWIEFSSVALLAEASLAIDTDAHEVDASWEHVYGLPSTVVVSDDMQNWTVIDDSISLSGSTFLWSDDWSDLTTKRFWRIQSWTYME
ncbi:MAG: hypothetical protein AAFX93_13960 [Verrucomicrobiota bacterium]